MADAEEDFTFVTANLPPCFFESPPLWRPLPRPESLEYDEVVGKMKLEICSCDKCRAMNINVNMNVRESCCYFDDDEREEKMDLLWEDLDDKCSRNSMITELDQFENSSSPEKNVKICCFKTLKLSKANGHSMNGLKASILELIRFLMKHTSGNSVKKLAW